MGDYVNFPKFTPSKIIELYRELDFQRRKLEEQRINVQDKLLMKDDKEVVINEIQEEVDKYKKQKQKIVLKDNTETTKKVQDNSEEESKDKRVAVVMETQRLRVEDNQQTKDILDREIELIRRLMMKVSQKKTTTRKEKSDNKRKTLVDYESMASGTLQHKVWRPGEQQQTTTSIEQLTSKDGLQNKVWDP